MMRTVIEPCRTVLLWDDEAVPFSAGSLDLYAGQLSGSVASLDGSLDDPLPGLTTGAESGVDLVNSDRLSSAHDVLKDLSVCGAVTAAGSERVVEYGLGAERHDRLRVPHSRNRNGLNTVGEPAGLAADVALRLFDRASVQVQRQTRSRHYLLRAGCSVLRVLRVGLAVVTDEQHCAPSCIPSFCQHQITPKTSRYTRCSMSMFPNVSINGRIRSSGQLGRWWYSISPCRNNECVRRFTVFAFNQRS